MTNDQTDPGNFPQSAPDEGDEDGGYEEFARAAAAGCDEDENLPYEPIGGQALGDLLAEDLPPIQWIIGHIITAGLLLFAGDPKVGKTLFWLECCIAVATGQPLFGVYPVAKGEALYLCLEGGKVALRARIAKMLAGAAAPTGITLQYETRNRLGGTLERAIEAWIKQHPDARLVVIDTLAAVAPAGRGGNDRHGEDYNLLAGLARVAARWPQLLIVLVHHTRKSESEDVMHRISGSQGLTAATDGNAVLLRTPGSKRVTLCVRPRNAEESDVVLQRHPGTLRLAVVGEEETAALSDGRQQILAILSTADAKGLGPKKITEQAEGLSADNVRQLLVAMLADRQIVKVAYGRYAAVPELSATVASSPDSAGTGVPAQQVVVDLTDPVVATERPAILDLSEEPDPKAHAPSSDGREAA